MSAPDRRDAKRSATSGTQAAAAELAEQAEVLFRAFRVIRRRVLARPLGMGAQLGSHLELLNLVRRQPGLRVREAARALRLASNTISTMAGQLESAGLLERRRDAEDQRGVRFYLTSTTQAELADWRDRRLDLLVDALAQLDAADRQRVTAALPALNRLVQTVRERS
ncbi:MAG: MarR family transcriptional regulator [Actinomycetota bacterium]|jgi:DNA-binding MarR family transcriptional regulator|nr:MarR family transcriptional regulator [Actinomycetota bacterium]